MATIKDIAKKTGVSVMTVSRAFNSPNIVKDEVRERILEVAKELDYVPNQAARSLAGSKSGVIQIVANMNPDDYYFTQLFTGAADVLSNHGYSIMINHKKALDFQHDGVIYMGIGVGEDIKLKNSIKKPFVLFGKSDLDIDWVDVDNIEGSYTITKYLIDQGHKDIGFIGIDQDELFTVERFEGFKKALSEHNLTLDQKAVFNISHSIESVKEVSKTAFMQKNITAYVCESDVLAYGLIEAAKEAGMSVPEDLSIVGFDGFLFNQMSTPHITTVKQPVYHIGKEIARLLIERIQKPEMLTQNVLIPATFEDGQSVKDLR